MIGKSAAAVVLIGLGCGVSRASGEVVYSNYATSQQYVVSSVDWWDDVTISGGGTLSSFSFYSYNALGGPSRVMTTIVSIFTFNQGANLPNGSLLGSFTMTSAPVPAGTALLTISSDLSGLSIVLPDNARLGIRFDFESNSGALLYGTPTIGSSTNQLWLDTPPTPFVISGVVNNIGMELQVVPAPGAAGLALLATGFAMRRRRSNA